MPEAQAPGAAPAAEAAPSTPVASGEPAKKQPIDNKDVQHWTDRANELLKSSGKSEAAVADAKPWHESLFACFTPVDTCALLGPFAHCVGCS
ncbi:MAG: hypothetical protein INR71_12960 [Terriglobus roseus]|nr:hypothetical protein [Terriglobus roseus]